MSVSVKFSREGRRIRGKFFTAKGEPHLLTVLLLQGFPGNEEDVLELGRRMARQGIKSLTFNYSGTYQSGGTFSLRNTLKDIQAAFDYLHREDVVREFNIENDELILGGYSYGGGMAVSYAVTHPEIKRIFTIAAADHGEQAREYTRNTAFSEMFDAIFEELRAPSGPVRFGSEMPLKELVRNPDPYDLKLCAKSLADRDLLLIGSWDDSKATIERNMLPFYRELMNENSKVHIMAFQDNHAFVKCRDELARTIVDWIKS
jgi:pimeloyl-ACP methyl ester carboxylesterase